jgi:outer membrane protein OmpA-like peptidoglycan-associated protein
LAPTAHAAGSSADIELVRPFFSPDGLPGFDSPVIEGARHSRYGGLTQYQRDPLIVYERQEELGAAVARRQVVALGASWDLGRAASARLVIPAALQWRSEVPDLSRDGPVLGDISAGMRFRFANTSRVQWGASLDLYLPTGTREAWMGESIPRGRIGAPGLVQLGSWDLLVDAAVMIRQPVITQQQFTLSQEIQAGLGARYHVWRDRVAVSAAYLSHNGMDTFFQSGVAENPSELLAVVQLEPSRDLQWDLGLGKGLADGYGTTELRVFAGLTWTRRPPPPEPVPQIVIAEVPKEVPPPVIEPEPEPEWEEEELAKVEGEKIVIREPIQFEFNTPNILPVSLPTLQYVAGLLNENWQIAHLVIEGHASDEGSFVYNYDLSIRRSRAIWEELLRSGVHPDRMSYRGMGEVVPVVVGGDEASLATNRRVEFRIVKQYAPDERPPDYRTDVRLPWSGEPARITTPVAPPPEPEPPKKPARDDGSDLDSFFDELEDETQQDDGAAPEDASGKEQAP